MARRKETHKHYFSVEGETEKWYLEWLEARINADTRATARVSFSVKVQKDPLKMAKSMTVLGKTKVCHVFDCESADDAHVRQFRRTLERMRDAGRLGRSISYASGYSNFTFELWILLHKHDARAHLGHRREYLQHINRVFSERFESLDEYKREGNFKRVLQSLDLDDVAAAVDRAKAIAAINEREAGFAEHCGYRYCLDNPATDLWRTVEEILKKAGLM